MIDRRFLGEWISERTEDVWVFHESAISVVGRVYLLSNQGNASYNYSRWSTYEEGEGKNLVAIIRFANQHNEVWKYAYEFKKGCSEIVLINTRTRSVEDVLHATSENHHKN